MTGVIHCPEITASKSKQKDRNFHVVLLNLVALGHPMLLLSLYLSFSQQKVGMTGYWEFSETLVQFSSVYLATIHDYEIQHKRNYYMAREPRRNHEAYRTWTPSYIEEYKTERAYME